MIFNSTVIEMYDDKFWISYSFWGCQSLKYIADVVTGSLKTGKDDILNFYDL